MSMDVNVAILPAAITIKHTNFVDNHGMTVSEMEITIRSSIIQTGKYSTEADVTFSMLNSTVHTKSHSDYGVRIVGCCASVQINNTSMRFANTVHRLFT